MNRIEGESGIFSKPYELVPREEALKVSCGLCAAPIGQPCRYDNGEEYNGIHLQRHALAYHSRSSPPEPKVGESGLGDEQFVATNWNHKTRSVLVWVDVDEGIADAVVLLNTIHGVRTFASCQGTVGEGGPEPYEAQVMIYADGAALLEVEKHFRIGRRGDGWLYVHPIEPSVAPQVQCDCIYQNDPYKAPEQHRRSCPIYVAMLADSVAPQGGEEEPAEQTTTEGIHKVHDINEDRIAKITGLLEEIKVLKSKLAESVAPPSLPTQDDEPVELSEEDKEFNALMVKYCGDNFTMQAGFQRGWLASRAAVPVAPLSEKEIDDAKV